jgi:hypothetical protein
MIELKNLKRKLICIVKTKNILEYNNFNTNIPEERYFVSIANVLKTVNKALVNQFILDFQKIIIHNRLPVFNIKQVIRIYKVWEKNKNYCNQLIYLATKSGKNIIIKYNDKNWDIILKYSINYNSNELYALFYIIARFFKIINTDKGVSNRILNELVRLQFEKKIPTNIKPIEKYVQKKYLLLFTIISCNKGIWSDTEYAYLLSKRFYSSGIIPDSSITQTKEFSLFLKKILNQNINYIFKYSISTLFKISKIYTIRPIVFENLIIPKNEFTQPPIPTVLATNKDVNSWISLGDITEHISPKSFVFPIAFSYKYFHLNKEQRICFFNILKGQSVRKQSLPFTLSKKGEHIFINETFVNKNTTLSEDIVIAEYLSKDVDYNFALTAARLLTSNKSKNDYYIRIFTSLFRKGLMPEYIQEVYDYMNVSHFFESKNKSFKTKKIINILKDVRLFHNENLTHNSLSYNNIPNEKFAKEVKKQTIINNGDVFEFIPLQSSKELFVEGYNMNHCVYNYAEACMFEGEVIYSLRKKIKNRTYLLLTIEVDNNKRIVQVRGKDNRIPTLDEKEIIELWARKEGLILMQI